MARILGVSTATVSKWEQGASEPSFETLKRICKMYNVSADYLLGLSENDPFLNKKRREVLTPESREALKLFEEFLIYKDKKEHKK